MSEDNFKYEAQNIDPRQINIVQKRSVSVDCFLERALDPVIEKCRYIITGTKSKISGAGNEGRNYGIVVHFVSASISYLSFMKKARLIILLTREEWGVIREMATPYISAVLITPLGSA